MRLADLEYALPAELIAQEPAAARTAARLLVLDRGRPEAEHARVADLPRVLRPGDLLVLNDTRVVPARVRGRRPSGGRLEVLFVRPLGEAPGGEEWDVLVRGSPRAGERAHLPDASGEWRVALGDGRWRLRVEAGEPILAWLERAGEVPLPPYIRRPAGPTSVDRERYQTLHARVPGAVAAPTAGLHFTPGLLAELAERGVESATLTLHVGPGTFLPIRADELEDFRMDPERYVLPAETVERVAAARARGGRVVAVGTTSVRALESAAALGALRPGAGEAAIFIRPGHRFRVVDALVTNFHLPRSPLLALVAALAGWERIKAVYDEAVRRRYRFYSFGDAMLVT
jgi:S-adenosylmethionine:tRNA ribosyltransferase-isomerase